MSVNSAAENIEFPRRNKREEGNARISRIMELLKSAHGETS